MFCLRSIGCEMCVDFFSCFHEMIKNKKVTFWFLTLVFNIYLNHHFTYLACMLFSFVDIHLSLHLSSICTKQWGAEFFCVSCFSSSCLELWMFIIDLGNNDLTKWSHNNMMTCWKIRKKMEEGLWDYFVKEVSSWCILLQKVEELSFWQCTVAHFGTILHCQSTVSLSWFLLMISSVFYTKELLDGLKV